MAVEYFPWKANTMGEPIPDFYREIASSNIEGINRAGTGMYNAAAGTTFETLWPDGSRYVWPTAESILTVSSDNAADTAAGTGAISVKIDGLLLDYTEATETVTLNGLTPVNTTTKFFRVNQLTVASAGSSRGNAGHIYVGTGTVTAGRPANLWNLIDIGDSISHSGIYTVPKGRATHWTYIQAGSQDAKSCELRLVFRLPTGVTQTLIKWQIGTNLTIEPKGFGFASEGIDTEWLVATSAGTSVVSGLWRGFTRNESI